MNSILDQDTRYTATMPCSAEVHLSEDQIDDHLIGDLAAAPAEHLATCAVCNERVAAAGLPIAAFDNVTLAWSERRSATLPLPGVSAQRPVWQRQSAWVTASFALAIGIAFTSAGHQINLRTASVQSASRYSVDAPTPAAVLTETASVDAAPAPAQINADNQMLQAISDDLDASAETPTELGIQPVNARPARALAAISVQD